MSTRKDARKALRDELATLTTFVEVYDYESLDFEGKSPVCMVHSDGTAPGVAKSFVSDGKQHALLVALWWRRDEQTEDRIDDLSAEVFDLLESLRTTNNLEIDPEFSALDYPVLDGVPYRRETIRVIVG